MRKILTIIFIIGVLVFGFLFFKENQPAQNINPVEVNQTAPTNDYQNTNTQNSDSQSDEIDQSQQSDISWTEQRNGWYYPPGWDGYSWDGSSAEYDGGSFMVTNPSTGTGIKIGGNPGTQFESGCQENQVETFNYGVSTSACVNGVFVFLFNPSARWLPSQDEKNMFGDFVLKNRS